MGAYPLKRCLLKARLLPNQKFCAVTIHAQTSLTVYLACGVDSFHQTPYHGRFYRHWVIATSKCLYLPGPWNLGRTSCHKSPPVHGDRYVSPHTHDSCFLSSSDHATTLVKQRTGLSISPHPPRISTRDENPSNRAD